jgi:hypothetical protein
MSGLKVVAWIQDYSNKEILQVNELNLIKIPINLVWELNQAD